MGTSTSLIDARKDQPSTYLRSWHRRGLLFLSLGTLLTSGVVSAEYVSNDESTIAEVIDQIDACMVAEMEEQSIPGAALALVVDGELVYERGYGVKHHAQGGAVDSNTLFHIGSIQKMMTAAAVMTQVEQGHVDLDEPVTQLIPELQFAGRLRAKDISVAHLLTHTAAIPDIIPHDCTADGTLTDGVYNLADVRLYAPPGVLWNYSNPGYSLAGLVAERASGIPYQQLVQAQVWEPAGMMFTTFSSAEAIAYGNYTFGHEMNAETEALVASAPDSDYCAWGNPMGANTYSTAGDLARWALLMMDAGGTVLAPSSVEAMQGRQVSRHEIPDSDYGYGIYADRYRGIETRRHGGDAPGWSSFLMWAPQERFAVAVLSNGGMGTKPKFTAACALEAVVELEPEAPIDYPTDPATWKRYRGLYMIRDAEGDKTPAYVAHVDNQLLVAVLDTESFEIEVFPAKQLFLNTFFVDLDRNGESNPLEEITFIKGSTPQTRRTMWLRNRSYVGRRILRRSAWRHGLELSDALLDNNALPWEIKTARKNWFHSKLRSLSSVKSH